MKRSRLLCKTLQGELCSLLAEAIPLQTASEACGVSARTVRAWIQQAADGDTDRELRAFAAAISRARAKGRVTLVRRIIAARDWRADAWVLSRCAPEEFGDASQRQADKPGEIQPTPVFVTINTTKKPEEIGKFPIRRTPDD